VNHRATQRKVHAIGDPSGVSTLSGCTYAASIASGQYADWVAVDFPHRQRRRLNYIKPLLVGGHLRVLSRMPTASARICARPDREPGRCLGEGPFKSHLAFEVGEDALDQGSRGGEAGLTMLACLKERAPG
jgi:hypothetical protein